MFKYVIFYIFFSITCNCNSERHPIRKSRSVLNTKLPRSNLADGSIDIDGSSYIPVTYFPEVEYPTDIFEINQLFFFKDNDHVSDPFAPEVKATFKAISKMISNKGNEVASKKVENAELENGAISKSIQLNKDEIQNITYEVNEEFSSSNDNETRFIDFDKSDFNIETEIDIE